MNQKLKSEKEVLENKNFQSILKKAKLTPQENKEFDLELEKMVQGLNKTTSQQ